MQKNCLIETIVYGPHCRKTCLRVRLNPARKLKLQFVSSLDYAPFRKANNKGDDQAEWIAGWSAPLLFANHGRQVFSG